MLPSSKLSRSLLLLAAMVLTFFQTPAAAADEPRSTEVSFPSAGHTLRGTIVAPAGARDLPAMVLVTGAGHTQRDDYRPEAEAFARAGIVTLIYDKRAGYSRATTSFNDLAADALAGVQLLRGRPEADPARVGLWGHSQGGWVVPLAAAQSRAVAYVITVGAGGLRADRTQLWSNRTHLAHAGVTGSLIDPIGTHLSRLLIAVGLFGDTGNDPAANLTRLRQPLLAVFGEHDRSTAPGESLTIFRQALERGGNRHYTLRVVRDANHNMRRSTNGFDGDDGPFAPGYVNLITSWIESLAAGPPAASADPAPPQALRSRPIPAPAWYESPALQVGAFLFMLVVFVSYPVGGLAQRLRRRSRARRRPGGQAQPGSSPHRADQRPAADPAPAVPVHLRWAPRVLTSGGLLAVPATVAYLFSIVATGATTTDAVVWGRPLWWLFLQVVALFVVAATVLTALRVWRDRKDADGRIRRTSLVAAGFTFTLWAAYWGLLTP